MGGWWWGFPPINSPPPTNFTFMPFYIYEVKKQIVEAKTRDEARLKLKLTHKDVQNFLNKATEKDLKMYPVIEGERQAVENISWPRNEVN
jgi:hypothetical protein